MNTRSQALSLTCYHSWHDVLPGSAREWERIAERDRLYHERLRERLIQQIQRPEPPE